MNLSLVERLVNALLYEGYMLYHYRPSAVKNRQRWNFGVVYPQAHSLTQDGPAQGVDAWSMQTECLVRGSQRTRVEVRVRFLHLLAREVGELLPTGSTEPTVQNFHPVETLEVGGQLFHTWQEAVECEVDAFYLPLSTLVAQPQWLDFTFPARQDTEPLRQPDGQVVGAIRCQQHAVSGAVEVAAAPAGEQCVKLTARILNLTPLAHASEQHRDAACARWTERQGCLSAASEIHSRVGAR